MALAAVAQITLSIISRPLTNPRGGPGRARPKQAHTDLKSPYKHGERPFKFRMIRHWFREPLILHLMERVQNTRL